MDLPETIGFDMPYFRYFLKQLIDCGHSTWHFPGNWCWNDAQGYGGVSIALTMAMMPALIDWGRLGHADARSARSGSFFVKSGKFSGKLELEFP